MVDSVAAELSQLAQLHRDGALTDAEFSAAKTLVLNGAGSLGPAPPETEPSAAVPSAAAVAAESDAFGAASSGGQLVGTVTPESPMEAAPRKPRPPWIGGFQLRTPGTPGFEEA
eukprot:SAG31_NODE_25957_length_451_cov_0.622159_1_plen_113_part_10